MPRKSARTDTRAASPHGDQQRTANGGLDRAKIERAGASTATTFDAWQHDPTLRRLSVRGATRVVLLAVPLLGMGAWLTAGVVEIFPVSVLGHHVVVALLSYAFVTGLAQLLSFDPIWQGDLEQYDHTRASLICAALLVATVAAASYSLRHGGSAAVVASDVTTQLAVSIGLLAAAAACAAEAALAGLWQLAIGAGRYLAWLAKPSEVSAAAVRHAARAFRGPAGTGAPVHLLTIARRTTGIAITDDAQRVATSQGRGLRALRKPIADWLDSLQQAESSTEQRRSEAARVLETQATNFQERRWDAIADALPGVSADALRLEAQQRHAYLKTRWLSIAAIIGTLWLTFVPQWAGTLVTVSLGAARFALCSMLVPPLLEIAVALDLLSDVQARALGDTLKRIRRSIRPGGQQQETERKP